MITIIPPNKNIQPSFNFFERLDISLKDDPNVKHEIADVEYTTFPDQEICMHSHTNLRGVDAFIIQSLGYNPNDSIMSLLLTIDAVRRASAERITAVIPYMAYARQDRKEDGRVPISARVVANLLESVNCDRVLTMELHSGQMQGFFNIPCDNLTSFPVFKDVVPVNENCVMVSPDAGGFKRAKVWAERFNAGVAIINKVRRSATDIETTSIVGDVRNRHAIIVDDMTSTTGTICKAAEGCMEAGASQVSAVVTHAPIDEVGEDRIDNSPLTEMFVSDTTPSVDLLTNKKIKVVSAAKLFADSIRSINTNTSVSSLL